MLERDWVPGRRGVARTLFGAAAFMGTSVIAAETVPVSPGHNEKLTVVASKCPTFSWTSDPRAELFELVVFELPAGVDLGSAGLELDPSMVALIQQVPGGALSWTPSLDSCLSAGGRYAWFVRSIVDPGTATRAEDWAGPALFEVTAAPSSAEIEAALRTLQAAADSGLVELGEMASPSARRPRAMASAAGSGGPSGGVAGSVAALRGEVPDTSGVAFGVVGETASPAGAGVAAAGAAGAADLHLDGAADGVASARVNQSQLDRASPNPTSFDVRNSGGGGMTLTVDGEAVVTTSTDSDLLGQLSCGPGQVALWNGGSWGCASGSGSGLDADRLDGLEAAAFAGAVHHHDDRYYLESELTSPGGTQIVHWTRLLEVPADIADGDDDALASISCGEDQLLRLVGGAWQCSAERPTRPLLPQSNSVTPLAEAGSFSSITVGVDGLPIISFYENESQSLRVAHCQDLACASFATHVVDDSAGVGEYNSIAIGSDGLPVISYYDGSSADLKMARCLVPDCSLATYRAVDPAGDTGEYTSIAIRANGLPIISYHDETLNSVLAYACGDLDCTGGSLTYLGPGGVGTSIALGADGNPVVSFVDDGNNVRVAYCNADCSTASSSVLTRGYPPTSLAIGADGLPIVSYNWTVFPIDLLGTAKCLYPNCATFDGGGFDIGLNAKGAITIGADGLPIVAFYDHSTTSINVGHCSSADCGGWGNVVPIDTVSAITSNLAPSITIGSDGLPLIVYPQSETGPLMLVRCSNRLCSPFVQGR